MSYCRRGPDSDVYMYQTEGEPGEFWIVCDQCSLSRFENDAWLSSPQSALLHLIGHINAGHKVPKEAIERLRNESR